MGENMNLQKRFVITRPGTHADDRQVVGRLSSEHGMVFVPRSDREIVSDSSSKFLKF